MHIAIRESQEVNMPENISPRAAPDATHTLAAAAATTNKSNSNNNNNNTDASTSNRGVPYYEKLRRDLRDTLQKKRIMDKNMVSNNNTPIYIQRDSQTDKKKKKNSGRSRRPTLPSRTEIPRRNNSRKHHQGIRQLHQGSNGVFVSRRYPNRFPFHDQEERSGC